MPCRSLAGQTSEEQVEHSFRHGQQALQQKQFAEAVDDFKKVLALDPSLIEAEVNLGLAYQGLFEYDLAVRHLAKAVRERPNLAGPTLIVGLDYVKLGAPDKAIPYFEKALKLNPSDRYAREALASCYLSQENFRDAAEQYHRIAVLNPDKEEAWFTLGHQYLDLAARLAYRGARLYPESAWGHRFLGDLLLQRNRWEEALREYQKAIGSDPGQPGLDTAMGQAYVRARKWESAEKEFRLELQTDPSYELAWIGLANLRLNAKQPQGALECIEEVWRISPEFLALQRDFPSGEFSREPAKWSLSVLRDDKEDAGKHYLVAALLSAADDTNGADREWQAFQGELAQWQRTSSSSALETGKDPCKMHRYSVCINVLKARKELTRVDRLRLGKALFALQQYEAAARTLEKMPETASENAEASYWLERTYQALGAETYARIEESFPGSWRTHQLRAEGYALRDRGDDAEKEFQAALELRPKEAELYDGLGELYLVGHNYEGAQRELEKGLTLDESRVHTLYLLGRVLVETHENEKAVPYLERALRYQPDLSEANSLLGTAYLRLGQFANAIPKLERAAPSDHYGNVYYQLYVAYRKMGKSELAQKALARCNELRRNALVRDQATVMGSRLPETEQ